MTDLSLLIVDDSAMYRRALMGIVETIPGVRCVGEACDGKEAMEKIVSEKPDVVTLDMEMPVMTGMEVIKTVTAKGLNTKLIIVSACSQSGAEIAIDALKLGAYDFITKPNRLGGGGAKEDIRRQLLEKLTALNSDKKSPIKQVDRQDRVALTSKRVPAPGNTVDPVPTPSSKKGLATVLQKNDSVLIPKAIAMGCSTGGPKALLKLFAGLQHQLNVPIFVVQHMPPLFTQTLAKSIDEISIFSVKEAENGDKPLPNHVYIAPGGRQMKLVENAGDIEIRITDDELANFCKPSVDYFFESMAEMYKAEALGVILSGMGSDGCKGLKKMKKHGITVVGQDEDSCVVYGMPRVAHEAGLVDQQVSIDQMAMAIECVLGTATRKSRA